MFHFFFVTYISYISLFAAYYIRCSSAECHNTLLVDGDEIGVIHMKRYLVAHEVLRDYMYQFLYARFEKF